MKTPLAKIGIVWIVLLLTLNQVKAEGLIPEELQWEYLGCTGADPTMLASSPTFNFTATGPYHAPANVVLVISMPHPEAISRVDFCNGDQCLLTLPNPILKEYEISLSNTLPAGHYVITANVYDLAGSRETFTTEFDVFPSNRYVRGIFQRPGNAAAARQDYLSSLIALDQERGDFLDKISDFSLAYGSNYPWFLRVTSEVNVPCQHILDPVLYPWSSPTQSTYGVINCLPKLNNQVVGGEPPMMAFGNSAANGTPLFVNQDYHFGIIAGRPALLGALKVEVYEKSDFENGAINIAPVLTQTNNFPGSTDLEQLDVLRKQFYIQDYHVTNNIHGKVVDFDTKIQYQFGGLDQTWGNDSFITPLVVTHRSANDSFYYKVSFKGNAPSLDGAKGVCMAWQQDQQGTHEAYNLSYALDFTQPNSWTTLFINAPHFQDAANPSSYEGMSLDELLHHTAPVKDALAPPGASLWEQLTELDKTPELKSHAFLDKLVDDLKNDDDLNQTALHIANYVQNNIELTDAVGLSEVNDPISLNSQGVMRDALGTCLEGQGSPIEQCSLLIYLLRKAGIPAAYVFPGHDATLMFDQQLSAMLHMQLRGTTNILGQAAGIPELIPVNYPWVAAYIDGKWVHLFPWIKDTEVKEGEDLWGYFPDGYKDGRQWLFHYLQGDPTIRSLSQEDNVAALFPLYAQKQLGEKNLTLDDVGIRFRNRQPLYQDWNEFPRPWQTPAIDNSNLVDHLSADFFDTISIQVFSDRNHNGQPDPGEPILETGDLRFADLHDRRLLLYHQIIPETTPPQYQMILSLEAYENQPSQSTDSANNSVAPVLASSSSNSLAPASLALTGCLTAVDPAAATPHVCNDTLSRCAPSAPCSSSLSATLKTGSDNTSEHLTTHTFAGGANPDHGDFRSAQKISTTLLTAANAGDPNDDILCYKITRTHHKQAATADRNYFSQFPGLGEIDSTVDVRPLCKGDMAVLSLDYGRVTEEMKNFELKKYLDYQHSIQENPGAASDPELATGQLLQLMGMTYYYHVSQFQEQLENWTKVHAISYRAHGLSKLSPEQGMNGPLTTTNNGGVDFNLCYPKVDMSFQRAVAIGNQTSHLESGANTEAGAQSMQLLAGEVSAQEHHIIDEFFNQADAISTVKLLDLTRQQGNEMLVLRQDNYQGEKIKSLATYSARNDINGFVTIWKNIDGFFESNKNDPFATVFVTPQPVTAAKQQGIPYTGMGAFSLSSTSASAWITDRMYVANGGFGGMMNMPIYSQQPETSTTMVVPTFNGGFSFFQNLFQNNASPQPAPSVLSFDHFQDANDQVAMGNQTLTPDIMGSIAMWNYTVNQAVDGNVPINFKLKNSGGQTAALWRGEMEHGNLGKVSYYTPSSQAIQQGVWKLVHDPVNVVTGEFYINALDLKLNGPMPLDLRRIYGSQNDANNNFGCGWKLGYFPYLLLSDDDSGTAPPSLIYAAEQDGSVIAYRYQAASKSWMPTIADNPELVNNNDGTHLASANHFNNKIFKVNETTYQLTSCDGTIRTFIVASFPVAGSPDIKRKRPYLDRWRDVNGNYYQFIFGQDRNANDYGELNLITSSNGSSLHFRYDPYGHIVEAFSSDGRHLKYSYDAYGDLVQVTLPDASTIRYQYQHATDSDEGNKTYSSHLITQVTKPNGRIIKNDYDAQHRVVTQYATVGLSPKPEIAAQFKYDLKFNDADKTISGTTSIKDAAAHQTIYEITQNQITAVHFPENRSIAQTWITTSGFKALASYSDRRGLNTTFDYDAKGNLIHQALSGNLTGSNNQSESATTQFSYNDKNLLATVTNQLSCSASYTYDDQEHPCSPTSITKTADGKVISTTQLSYQNVGGACGLLADINLDGAGTHYKYDGHGFLTSMTQKTGTHDPDVVTNYTSDERGEIVATFQSDGSQKKYFYDALGNLTGTQTCDAGGNLIDWRFNYYNQNGEIEWEQGARFNPVDYAYYDYDRAGNLLHKASCLSAGIATTSYQYDAQGNCISATDPNGNTTTMSYDGLGEMLSQKQGHDAKESFTYEAGGKVATHQTLLQGTESYSYTSTGLLQSASDANGTIFQYCYDLSGRLIQATLPNKSYWKVTYDGNTMTRTFCDAAGKSLGSISETYDGRGNLLQKTDLAGNQWSYSYDGLNRLKTEQGPPASSNSAAQSTIHIYGPNLVSTVNGVGERTNQIFDALGRPTLTTVFNKDGSMAQNISNEYSGDHQSVMTIVGTGDNAIRTTMYRDEAGRPTMLQHADGKSKKWNYDANGNMSSFTDEEGNRTVYTYDELDHLFSEMRADGVVINYSYNEAGELLTRSMPQGLMEKNSYNNAGQKTSSSLIGSDGVMTRHYSYGYDQGLLSSIEDPRGGKISINYDAWMHPVTVSSSGSAIPEQNQITSYSYDLQGLLASVAQQYSDPSTGPSTLVSRGYDGYGQLTSEAISLNGTNVAAWSQAWDGAGRRTALNWNLDNKGKGAQYAFSYNALGLMTTSQNTSGTCSYVYGDNGLLLGETTPAGSKNLQRDQQGRLIHQTLLEQSQESISWRSDGKMSSYSIVGSANETRNYNYDVLGHLTQEPYTLTEGVDPNLLSVGTHTTTYAFDSLGLRLKQEVTPEIKNSVSEKNNFSQVVVDDLNNGVNKTYSWNSSYDAAGAVTARGIDAAISQDLTWDSLGRLVTVSQRNNNNRGYNWKTTYDGLGRRLQTSYCDATGNQTTSSALTINYYYDPEVEFLELGRDYFGRTWNLYGPDCSGTYGGAQGVGGLETTTAEGHDEVHGIVNNVFGDILGITTGGVFNPWGNVLGGYGAMPGSSVNADLVPQWRSHYLDWTGFYYMGTRYYEPKSGRFLSPDPLGHDASLSLYDYCDGDPVNGLDPDGRCVEREYLNLDETGRQNFDYMAGKAFHAPSVQDGINILKGIPLSFADLNIEYAFGVTPQGAVNFSGNGVLMDEFKAVEMAKSVRNYLKILPQKNVTIIKNPTHGLFFDLVRCIGQNLGATDITSLKAADAFNAAGPGEINAVMFSNGTTLFGGAMSFVRPEVRARIHFQGFGGQWNINQGAYGLKRSNNKRHPLDVVPLLTPWNWFQLYDVIEKEDSFDWKSPLKIHNFKNIYAPQIIPIP
ncbi:MAG: hypothetical protein K2W97_09030 [Chthoniobacterales bacterium]|nr:hypothetical protein [Chthoniobacterales bacterium]